MSDAPLQTATKPAGSLWTGALQRLRANRAAMASIIVLAVIALAAIVGPLLTLHPYDRVYPDYVGLPASLSAYPTEAMIEPAIARVN